MRREHLLKRDFAKGLVIRILCLLRLAVATDHVQVFDTH